MFKPKNYISVYVCGANDRGYVAEQHKRVLPKASIGRGCIRFKRLADINLKKLAAVIREGARVPFAAIV